MIDKISLYMKFCRFNIENSLTDGFAIFDDSERDPAILGICDIWVKEYSGQGSSRPVHIASLLSEPLRTEKLSELIEIYIDAGEPEGVFSAVKAMGRTLTHDEKNRLFLKIVEKGDFFNFLLWSNRLPDAADTILCNPEWLRRLHDGCVKNGCFPDACVTARLIRSKSINRERGFVIMYDDARVSREFLLTPEEVEIIFQKNMKEGHSYVLYEIMSFLNRQLSDDEIIKIFKKQIEKGDIVTARAFAQDILPEHERIGGLNQVLCLCIEKGEFDEACAIVSLLERSLSLDELIRLLDVCVTQEKIPQVQKIMEMIVAARHVE